MPSFHRMIIRFEGHRGNHSDSGPSGEANSNCIAKPVRADSNTRVSGQNFFPTEFDLIGNGAHQAALHERASATTRKFFGRKIFVRAVVEVSNI